MMVASGCAISTRLNYSKQPQPYHSTKQSLTLVYARTHVFKESDDSYLKTNVTDTYTGLNWIIITLNICSILFFPRKQSKLIKLQSNKINSDYSKVIYYTSVKNIVNLCVY